MKCLENLKNNIDFFLRQHLTFSRKNYSEKNESKEGLFADFENPQKALEREKFLLEKYDLDSLKLNSTRQNYLENLYLLDILDKYLAPACPPPQPSPSRGEGVLDIGCKNWSYVKSEYAFFKKFFNTISAPAPSPLRGEGWGEGAQNEVNKNSYKHLQLDGIELDSNRLYSNFYSRKEAAKFYTKGLENVNYIEGDFLNHNHEYDFIIWILPFVVENPLVKWGLPLRYFKPEEMLKKAYDSMKNSGSLLILNQGKAEHKAQIELCKKLKIKYTTFGEVKSDFLHYNIERCLILIKK